MYAAILTLHNILRWMVLILGIIVLIRALRGWLLRKTWSKNDRIGAVFFTIAMDMQILLGLILYLFFSPFALKGLLQQGMAFVMGNGEFRFYAVEHGFIMALAVVFAHLGSILPKKHLESTKKHQWAVIAFGLAILLLLFGIPWGRPLFPNL